MHVVKQVWTWGEVDFLTEWPGVDAKEFTTVPSKERALPLDEEDAEILAHQLNDQFGGARCSFSVESV